MKRRSSAFFPMLAAMCLAVSAGAQSNGVLSEVWLNLGGTAVADLTNAAAFPSNPSFDEGLTSGFETPTDVYDDYGQRLRALLIPPVTGSYVFLIASDDNSQLFLSTNDTPAGARLIARVDAWTPPRQYHNQASQRSAAISLIAGQRYYLEALMKEGGGGDNLAVAWQKPGDPEPANDSAPIPNANLLPFGLGPPVFTVQPSNTTIVEGGVATFSIQLARAVGASFQWLCNGTNIPAATAASHTLSPVRLADHGSTFHCRAANAYGVSNSSTAVLTVVADTNRPAISFAQNFGDDTLITVGFSEPLDPVSAGTLANYTLNNGAGILGVTLLGDATTVLLRSTPLSWGTTYTLTVNNVRDLAQTPNTILPNSQRSFTLTYAPLDVSYIIGTNEPAGPSSRRTALAISEIMYRPSARADGRNLEFIEIYNSNPWAEDLGGHRLSGDVGYTFPAGTTIGALSYCVIAANPADVQAVHGLANVLGPLTNSTPGNNTNLLDNGGGMIRLRDELNAVLLEVNYDDEPPWPAAADGAGHSLVLARPSYGENDVHAWARSDRSNGSPGAYDVPTANPWRTVLINEVLTHTDPPLEDFIELFNYSSTSVNVGNCVLTDDFTTNKFRIPAGTTIPAHGFLAYKATQLGFALSSGGETVYLLNTDGSRVLDALRFGDQENSVSFGRFPDGNPRFGRLSSNTRGASNTRPRTNDVVINEIMYHPVSGDDADEFVEVHNRGSSAVNLEKWRLRGGISFTFPAGTVIPPGGYLVVANNAASLLTTHPNLSSAQVLGNYGGKLGNGGDVISLDKPDQVASTNQLGQWVTNTIHVVVDEVTYGTGGRWGRWSDGGGSSLERRDPRADGRLAPTWADSDETARSGWTTIEFTGVLDNGAMASADQLQIFLLGPGECLVDSVEVIPQGGANRIVNGNFDSGAGGWFFQGTHEDSVWQGSGGFSGGCLRVVATDRGDPGANRIRTVLTQPLAEGSTATLRAKVKWLKGHPEILLRLHGNWLEAAGSSLTTRNLGSPGAQNTQFRTNAGPAIMEVQHSPVLPTAGQAVIVTAQMADPDSISYAVLHYRVDPATNYTAAAMTNRGAGFYSVAIPGQTAGKRVAFFVEARDGYNPVAMSRFPEDAPVRECLVGFGESVSGGSFGDYRLWLTQQNVNRWAAREKQSNRALDATFVYGGFRVCYNVGTLYSGSPWHTPQYNSPAGNLCDYEVNFAKDDGLLGASDFVLGTIGNLNSDPTFQAERTAYWIGRELGTPYLHRRYIRMFFNAQLRSTLYEDCQQPDREVVSEFFPDDDGGNLHKIEDWFEFNDSGDIKLGNVDATLENFMTGGVKKTARYRWNWRPRAVRESADFTNLFALVDAVNASQPEPFRSHVLGQVDVEEFMRVLAMERIVGNWDSYGYYRGKNMYAYKPQQGRWALLPWDIDFVMSSGGSATDDPLFGSNEPLMDRLRAFPEFQRAYWRAFEDAANGPLQPANLAAQLDPRYSALLAQGAAPASPQSLKDYAAQRRSFIVTQLATVASPFTVISSVTVSNGLGVITGTAPVGVATLAVNGAAWTVRWTSVNNWFAIVPLQTGSNFFSVVGLDLRGQPVVGASNGVSRIHNVAVPSPVGTVVINEILFTPVLPDAGFVELFNISTTNAFDLSGWNFNGLDYTFPNGTIIGPRGFVLLAKNHVAFNALYGPGILVFDEFSGNLQSDGETLSLLKPGPQPGTEVVVDRVRYEAASPWPAATSGASLQLRDPIQDNSRVSNWELGSQSGPQWVRVTATGNATSSRIYLYLQSAGDIYLDDLNLVAGSVPESGPNLLANGGFESALSGTWNLTANFAQSGLSTAIKRAGNSSLNVVATAAGSGSGNAIYQDILPALTVGQPYSLSFWYLPSLNGGPLTIRLSGSSPGVTIDPAPSASAGSPASPGAMNSVFAALPAFPALWLNEAHPDNVTGPLDNAAEREPWIELHNAGTTTLNLGGCFLSDSYTNLSRWAFPSNTSIPAGGFTLVWCDSQTNQSAVGAVHSNFRLASGAGKVALSHLISGTNQLVDYLTYTNLPSNWSYGNLPDAQPFYRSKMFQFTPGTTNSAASPPLNVFINEWLADNTLTLADPADNNYEDWFEIYNPGPNIADLGGYYLTDNLTNKFQYLVPANGHYLIPPAGFLLVWADNETGQNNTNRADLHAGFALSKGGDAIGIFAADGTRIDAVTFGAQTSDVSEGRFPQGSGGIFSMTPTPRAANVLANAPPVLAVINDAELTLGQTLVFTASATDPEVPPQVLEFSLGAGAAHSFHPSQQRPVSMDTGHGARHERDQCDGCGQRHAQSRRHTDVLCNRLPATHHHRRNFAGATSALMAAGHVAGSRRSDGAIFGCYRRFTVHGHALG